MFVVKHFRSVPCKAKTKPKDKPEPERKPTPKAKPKAKLKAKPKDKPFPGKIWTDQIFPGKSDIPEKTDFPVTYLSNWKKLYIFLI